MAAIEKVWIVQDKESGLFMAPMHGDVGYVRLIKDAGHFEDAESALDTAAMCLGADALVFSFYIEKR